MIEFSYILCPIDFSDTSVRALAYAATLARQHDALLEILHVVPAVDNGIAEPSPRAGEQDPALLTVREGIMVQMRRASDLAGAASRTPRFSVQEGRAHDMIVYRAQAQRANLLVMGTHGRSGFNRLILGSVTEKVLRTAPCPVLTVPPAASAAMTAPVVFKKILCPIDYSPSALKALQYALALGRQTEGCVTVLNALEYMDPEEPCEHVDFDIRRHRQHLLEHARERLHAQLAEEPRTRCEIEEVVAINRAYKEILRRAAASDVDLIVIGAQGSGGLDLMLYGSNTQHVVRAATCPVLTVRL